MEADHWKKARAAAEERARQNPNDALTFAQLSRVEENFGLLDLAVSYAERAVGLAPANADCHAQLAEAYAVAAQNAGVLKQLGYVHKIRHELDAALSLDPRQIDALLVEMMFDWKAPRVAGGSKEKAVEVAARITAINPGWGYLAQAQLYGDEDLPRAQRALEQAARTAPVIYRGTSLLADFYASRLPQPRLQDAERLANAAIQSVPGRVQCYSVLAKVYAEESRWADLDALLTAATRAVPDDLSPYYHAAKTLLTAGRDLDRATRYLDRYLSQSPEGRAPTLSEARELRASAIPNHAIPLRPVSRRVPASDSPGSD